MTTRIQRRLEALYGLERRKDKLGLDGTRALLRALGDPHDRFRSVHVAGTNGKGSVCALVERVLREAGHRTGLYTSPHLVDFRERIRVSGRWVDEDWLENALDRIEALPEGRDRTFFEVATVLGFLYFAEQGVEIAVVEVGLGGRLDCTNVITPEVSVITTIGLDHTEILGDSIEKIAIEKAGIIKPGVPVVMPSGDLKAFLTVREVAKERGAPQASGLGPRKRELLEEPEWGRPTRMRAWYSETVWGEVDCPDETRPGLPSNQKKALEALQALVLRGFAIPAVAVRAGLASVRWPGRLEPCPDLPRLWWDGAHNPLGIFYLGRAWALSLSEVHRPAPFRVVVALSRDKDLRSMIGELRRAFEPLSLIATRSRSERAADPAAIASEAARQGVAVEAVEDVPAAVDRALAAGRSGDVLLTGSLFAVGEAMEAFGGAPGEWL